MILSTRLRPTKIPCSRRRRAVTLRWPSPAKGEPAITSGSARGARRRPCPCADPAWPACPGPRPERRSSSAGRPTSGTRSPEERPWPRSPRPLPGRDLQPPFPPRRPPDLELHRESPDLALGLPEPAIGGLGGPGFQPLLAPRDELVSPGGQAMGLHPELAGERVDVLTAEQAHQRVGLATHRPAELLLTALLLGNHRHLGPPPAPSSRGLSGV